MYILPVSYICIVFNIKITLITKTAEKQTPLTSPKIYVQQQLRASPYNAKIKNEAPARRDAACPDRLGAPATSPGALITRVCSIRQNSSFTV